MNRKLLITGAAGFIGSHLCDFYIKKNYNVIGIDNFITGSKKNLKQLFNSDKFILLKDDVSLIKNIKYEIDGILHFASPASPIDFKNLGIEILKSNSIGTLNMLEIAKNKKIKILLASTSEIYGDPLIHPQSESYYGNVNTVGPRSVYDEGKRFLEAASNFYKIKYGLDVKIARIFNTYGPRMKKDDGRVIPNFINQAINNEPFSIYGDGNQTRSFCYIDDLVNGIASLFNSTYNMPINLGNPNEHSIIELAHIISKIVKTKSNFKFFDITLNDPKMRKPDISLAKKILNWSPTTTLDKGITQTLNYYKNYF